MTKYEKLELRRKYILNLTESRNIWRTYAIIFALSFGASLVALILKILEK